MANNSKKIDEISVDAQANAKETVSEVIESLNKTVDDVSGNASDKVTARKVEIPTDEQIAVRSAVFGGLTWKSPRSGALYRWNNIGDTEFISFGELITMNNTSRDYLFKPLVILRDERVVEYFRLAPVYEKFSGVNDLEKLFNEGNLDKVSAAMRNIVNTGIRDIAISKIRNLRTEHKLTNIDIIRIIEKILCFDME